VYTEELMADLRIQAEHLSDRSLQDRHGATHARSVLLRWQAVAVTEDVWRHYPPRDEDEARKSFERAIAALAKGVQTVPDSHELDWWEQPHRQSALAELGKLRDPKVIVAVAQLVDVATKPKAGTKRVAKALRNLQQAIYKR
jgi:hypothetical protein